MIVLFFMVVWQVLQWRRRRPIVEPEPFDDKSYQTQFDQVDDDYKLNDNLVSKSSYDCEHTLGADKKVDCYNYDNQPTAGEHITTKQDFKNSSNVQRKEAATSSSLLDNSTHLEAVRAPDVIDDLAESSLLQSSKLQKKMDNNNNRSNQDELSPRQCDLAEYNYQGDNADDMQAFAYQETTKCTGPKEEESTLSSVRDASRSEDSKSFRRCSKDSEVSSVNEDTGFDETRINQHDELSHVFDRNVADDERLQTRLQRESADYNYDQRVEGSSVSYDNDIERASTIGVELLNPVTGDIENGQLDQNRDNGTAQQDSGFYGQLDQSCDSWTAERNSEFCRHLDQIGENRTVQPDSEFFIDPATTRTWREQCTDVNGHACNSERIVEMTSDTASETFHERSACDKRVTTCLQDSNGIDCVSAEQQFACYSTPVEAPKTQHIQNYAEVQDARVTQTFADNKYADEHEYNVTFDDQSSGVSAHDSVLTHDDASLSPYCASEDASFSNGFDGTFSENDFVNSSEAMCSSRVYSCDFTDVRANTVDENSQDFSNRSSLQTSSDVQFSQEQPAGNSNDDNQVQITTMAGDTSQYEDTGRCHQFQVKVGDKPSPVDNDENDDSDADEHDDPIDFEICEQRSKDSAVTIAVFTSATSNPVTNNDAFRSRVSDEDDDDFDAKLGCGAKLIDKTTGDDGVSFTVPSLEAKHVNTWDPAVNSAVLQSQWNSDQQIVSSNGNIPFTTFRKDSIQGEQTTFRKKSTEDVVPESEHQTSVTFSTSDSDVKQQSLSDESEQHSANKTVELLDQSATSPKHGFIAVERGRAKPVLINSVVEPHTEGRKRVIRSILGKAIKHHQSKYIQDKKATRSLDIETQRPELSPKRPRVTSLWGCCSGRGTFDDIEPSITEFRRIYEDNVKHCDQESDTSVSRGSGNLDEVFNDGESQDVTANPVSQRTMPHARSTSSLPDYPLMTSYQRTALSPRIQGLVSRFSSPSQDHETPQFRRSSRRSLTIPVLADVDEAVESAAPASWRRRSCSVLPTNEEQFPIIDQSFSVQDGPSLLWKRNQ